MLMQNSRTYHWCLARLKEKGLFRTDSEFWEQAIGCLLNLRGLSVRSSGEEVFHELAQCGLFLSWVDAKHAAFLSWLADNSSLYVELVLENALENGFSSAELERMLGERFDAIWPWLSSNVDIPSWEVIVEAVDRYMDFVDGKQFYQRELGKQQRCLLDIMRASGGKIDNQQWKEHSDLSGIYVHVAPLIDEGLVELHWEGKKSFYFLTPSGKNLLEKGELLEKFVSKIVKNSENTR